MKDLLKAMQGYKFYAMMIAYIISLAFVGTPLGEDPVFANVDLGTIQEGLIAMGAMAAKAALDRLIKVFTAPAVE